MKASPYLELANELEITKAVTYLKEKDLAKVSIRCNITNRIIKRKKSLEVELNRKISLGPEESNHLGEAFSYRLGGQKHNVSCSVTRTTSFHLGEVFSLLEVFQSGGH